MKNSCLIIAGEKSGEDHALTFLPELIKLQPQTEFFGVGGERLQNLNVDLIYHTKDFSGIGFTEVLSKIPFYYKAFAHILEEVEKRDCKVAILIDFQTFNLKLARKLKKRGVKVLYYVAPQAWVWKAWRAKVIQQCVHTLFTILPFEKEWFMQRGVSKIKSIVHPLMLEHKNTLAQIEQKTSSSLKKKILLLPGSRNNEVATLLPSFVHTIPILKEKYGEIDFGIVTSDSVNPDHYKDLEGVSQRWNSDKLSDALLWADYAIAASGTVTLTSGLYEVPTVVCYKVSYISALIIKYLVPYTGPISLTNIIHNKMLFPELTQKEVSAENICMHLEKWIDDKDLYTNIKDELKKTKNLLTGDEINIPQYMSQVIDD